jgi:hypothetical protein
VRRLTDDGEVGDIDFLVLNANIPTSNHRLPSTEVKFLHTYVLSVEDDRGYEIHHIDPIYEFQHEASCDAFMQVIRRKFLVGSFLPMEIARMTSSGSQWTVVSRLKVVRLWQQPPDSPLSPVSLTYLDKYGSPFGNYSGQVELPLALFLASAQRSQDRKTVTLRQLCDWHYVIKFKNRSGK